MNQPSGGADLSPGPFGYLLVKTAEGGGFASTMKAAETPYAVEPKLATLYRVSLCRWKPHRGAGLGRRHYRRYRAD